MSDNSFDARAELDVSGRTYEIFRLDALQSSFDVARLPFSLKVLLENLLGKQDGGSVSKEDIEALARWDAAAEPSQEIAFTPARVVMQDFTGVPAVVDLAAMRDAMADLGGAPAKINPLVPAELVVARPAPSSAPRSRSTSSARATPSPATPSASSSATRSATRSCAGARSRSTTSPSSHPTPASSTRSTSSTSRGSSSSTRSAASGTPTRSSGPTRTRR